MVAILFLSIAGVFYVDHQEYIEVNVVATK